MAAFPCLMVTVVMTSWLTVHIRAIKTLRHPHRLFTYTLLSGSRSREAVGPNLFDCARQCNPATPGCRGFELDPSTSVCEPYINTNFFNGVPDPEKSFHTRSPQCPEVDNFYEARINSSIYCLSIITGVQLNFDEALASCQALGGTLMTLDNAEKLDALDLIMTHTGVAELGKTWVGATDRLVEGQWLDMDGLPINMSLFYWRWHYDPDTRDCAALQGSKTNSNGFYVKDRSCSGKRDLICETRPG